MSRNLGGRPRKNVVNPNVKILETQLEQIDALATERGLDRSTVTRQALALALPKMARWRRYTLSEIDVKYAPDVMTEPDKYDARFPDEDILAAGFNPVEFGEYFYSVLTKKFDEHPRGARVIIDPLRDENDIAIEVL